jgi:hypothetical protein
MRNVTQCKWSHELNMSLMEGVSDVVINNIILGGQRAYLGRYLFEELV